MVRIYLDTGDLAAIKKYAADERIQGFTTNPSLLCASGVTDYLSFAQSVLNMVREQPVSLEIFADDYEGMIRQAKKLSALAENVFVKLPFYTTQGEPAFSVCSELPTVKWNITACCTIDQMVMAHEALGETDAIVSIFAGRIADTGVDAVQLIKDGLIACKPHRKHNHLNLWASARQAYSVHDAENAGCDIITLSPSLLDKYLHFGKDLNDISLETVRQFARDAQGLVL